MLSLSEWGPLNLCYFSRFSNECWLTKCLWLRLKIYNTIVKKLATVSYVFVTTGHIGYSNWNRRCDYPIRQDAHYQSFGWGIDGRNCCGSWTDDIIKWVCVSSLGLPYQNEYIAIYRQLWSGHNVKTTLYSAFLTLDSLIHRSLVSLPLYP